VRGGVEGGRPRVPDRHEWLGIPDGGVADVPFDDLVDAIAAVLAEESPDVVGTFGPAASLATPTTWERRVSREWHVIAWPPHPGPPHTDIFEALP
jgi:hypothetical protein